MEQELQHYKLLFAVLERQLICLKAQTTNSDGI